MSLPKANSRPELLNGCTKGKIIQTAANKIKMNMILINNVMRILQAKKTNCT